MTPREADLMAQKLVSELSQIARSYGKTLPSPEQHYRHDFALMCRWDDLTRVSLVFHQAVNDSLIVKAEYTFNINGDGKRRISPDTSNSPPIVPIPHPFQLAVIITRGGQGSLYQDKLRIGWSGAPGYRRPEGHTIRDGHFSRKTGGRGDREVFIGDSVRRTGRVKSFNPSRGYGFIIPDGGALEVFVHRSRVPVVLVRGQRVSFIPLHTGKGVQAESVRILA